MPPDTQWTALVMHLQIKLTKQHTISVEILNVAHRYALVILSSNLLRILRPVLVPELTWTNGTSQPSRVCKYYVVTQRQKP